MSRDDSFSFFTGFRGAKKNQKLAKGAHTSTTPRPGQREASGVTHGIVSDGEKCIPPAKSKPKKRLPVNEEEAADPVTLASILWSDEEYTVEDLSRKFEGKFPIIIRVRKGFTGECLNLARSQVLQVHSYCKQRRVIACDSNKRKCSIPLDYPMNIFVRGSASGGEHWRFSAAMEVKLLPVNVKVTRVDDSVNQKGACLTGAELTLLEVKDAVFLRANSIKDGWIDQSRIILIPDFLDTQFSVAVGMVSASDLEWTDYHSMFSRAVRHLKFYELTGQDHVICDACSDVHVEDQNKNQIINPLHKSSVKNNNHQPLQYENLPPEPPAITTLDYKAQKRRQSETSAPNSPGIKSAPILAHSGATEGVKITTLDKAPKRSHGSTSSREDSVVSMSASEETGSSNGGPASQLTTVDDDSADFPIQENVIRKHSIDNDIRQQNGNADRVIVGDISRQKSETIAASIYENTENVERRENNNTESEFPSRNSVRFRDRVSFVPGADNSNFSSLNSNDPTNFQRSVSVEMENQKNRPTGFQRNLSVDSTLDHAASYQRQQSGTSESSSTGEVEGMFEPVIELASTLYDDDDEELPAFGAPATKLYVDNSTKVNGSKSASTNGVTSAVNMQNQIPKSRPHYVRSASRISNDSVHSSQGSTRTNGSRPSSRAEIGVEPESPRTPLEISHKSLFRDREKSVKQLASAFQSSDNTDEVPLHRPKSLHVTRSSDSNRSDPSPRTEVKSPIKPAHSFDPILQIDEKIPSNESKSQPNKPQKPLPSTKPSKEKLDKKMPPKQPVKPVARPTVIISNKTTEPSSQISVDNSNKNNNINNVIVTPKTAESTKNPESTKIPNVAIVQPNKKPVALKSPIKSPGTKPEKQKKINPDLGIEKVEDIPNELVGLGVRDVGFCLRLLGLGQHEKEFERQQVDGARLCDLNESLLQTNFNLTVFNASKLMRFIRGWRP